jgi:hypothetical protein
MRIGEALAALRWTDLELDADVPWVRVDATMVVPVATQRAVGSPWPDCTVNR